jgi:hypothetical protein
MQHDSALEAYLAGRRIPSAPLKVSEKGNERGITRVKYTHDALIDLIIARPMFTQVKLAEVFGYSASWVGRVMNSEVFQARLAERKADIVDPSLVLSIEERLKAVTSKSLDIVLEKLEHTPSLDSALKVLDMSAKALGYGARSANVAVQQNFVVAMPQKIPSAHEWADNARKGALALPPDLERIVEGG